MTGTTQRLDEPAPGAQLGDLPLHERTVPRLLRRAVESVPHQPAFVEPGGRSITYAELENGARRLATSLRGLGLGPGDRVVVLLDQHVDTVVTWMGANLASVVFVPLNTALKGDSLRYVIEHSRARVAVIEGKWCDRLASIADELTVLRTVVVREGGDADTPSRFARHEFSDLLAAEPVDDGEPGVSDISAIVYTSGTEGRPKGVLIPHGHAYTSSFSHIRTHRDTEIMMITLPLFHAGGLLTSALQCIRAEGTGVLPVTFSPTRFWEDVRRYRCTHTLIVGPMALMLLNQPARPDDREHDMRTMIMFPAIPAVDEFSRRFGVRVGVGYGQTEQGPCLLSAPGDGRPGLCGVPTSAFEARLVDESDIEVTPGEVGELVLRPRQPWSMVAGYLDAPERTAAAFRNLWYHTGDMFRLDESGQWAFIDRAKDALRRRGENVSSLAVEAHLLSLPQVVEAAVVAVPSDLGEDEIKAVIVTAPGSEFDHGAALRILYQQMPYFMVPRYFEIIDAMPKTHSMRIQKAELRASGLTGTVWDCEAAGFRITRHALVEGG